MKLSKSIMKKFLILLLGVFVVIPIVLMVVGMSSYAREGFFNMKGDKNYKSDMKLSAIDISGIELSGGNLTETITGKEGDKLYCVFGNITCAEGWDVSCVGTDEDDNSMCQCISGTTIDNTHASCTGKKSFFGDKSYRTFYLFDDDGCLDKDTSFNFDSFEQVYGSELKDIGKNFADFTTILKKSPFTIYPDSETSMNEVKFTGYDPNKFEHTDVSFSTCFLLYSDLECQSKLGKCSSSKTDDDEDDDTTSGSDGKISCNAHYGAETGDNLCCGQTGVVQKDSRVCPMEYPICKSFKCGSKWGTCHAEDEDDE